MSSTVVRKWLEERDESSDGSGWIVEDSALESGWVNSDAWLDTADEHLDLVSDAVILAISRRRAGLCRPSNRDLLAGYSGGDSAPELTRAAAAAVIEDLEDY
jgi:hypothetical protein